MAGRGRAVLQLVNGKQLSEQKLQSALSRDSNATLETRAHHIGAVNTDGSHMPPNPRFAALLETRSLETIDQTMKVSGICDDVHASCTIFERREAVGYNGTAKGYPFGEGTSKSRPPLPKWMTTETSSRRETSSHREDIPVAMQKGKFAELSSSMSLATTTTKAVEMEWQSLPPWANVGSSSQHDDINLELTLTCSSRSNYTGRLLETGKLVRANVERPKAKSNLTINLDDIDDGRIADRDTNVKRLKLGKLDDVGDCSSANAWSKRWLFNGGKVVKKPEVMVPRNDEEQRRPSIAAMAMMGRAFLNDYHKPCELQKRGAVTFWKL